MSDKPDYPPAYVRGEAGVSDYVLQVDNLTIEFQTAAGPARAVDGVSYDVRRGEMLGIVGESGSGKSLTALSLLGLLPDAAGITGGTATFGERDLLSLNEREMRPIRGNEIAMIFQDPMTSLNPVLTIGYQLAEIMKAHQPSLSKRSLRTKVNDLLRLVGMPNADQRYGQYPHEFSGGMRQRVMIAMAMANEPAVLIADEPTTALDVTVQAQVLDVLKRVNKQTGTSTMLITHDLGVVAEMCERVIVMYAGTIVEVGDVWTIFHHHRHPYTIGLLDSLPRIADEEEWLRTIPGSPSSLENRPPGCPFHTRCFLSKGRKECSEETPTLRKAHGDGHWVACHFAEETDDRAVRTDSIAPEELT